MVPYAPDEDIQKFISAYVPTVWALELLVALKASRQRRWSVEQLVKELRATTELVHRNLAQFERLGLAARLDEGWSYRPANSWLDQMVEAMAERYRERPSSTIQMIHARDPIQSLADAFKFRGPQK